MTHSQYMTIEQARLQRLFAKAELFELPAAITLNRLGFYHWVVSRTNMVYFVTWYADALIGQYFTIARHVGNPHRGRQCDLCRRVLAVSKLISIRSSRALRDHESGYHAIYSYICSDVDECREHVYARSYLERLLNIHAC